MANSSYIYLQKESKQQEINLQELKELLLYYSTMLSHTGEQLDWDYKNVSFPYVIQEEEHKNRKYLLLTGTDTTNYHSLLLGVDQDDETGKGVVQITLTPNSTFADKSKANEFAKFLAKKLKGELKLFNGRSIWFHKMKI